MIAANWIAFLLYAAAAIALGWLASRRKESATEYWTAGRSLSGPAVGVSISAGFMSVSWSCVYAVQLFYWYGLGAIWLITVPWIVALGGIYWLSHRYHGLQAFSQPEMVRQRFGIRAQRLVAVALTFVFLAWGGAEIYVAANLLAPGMATSTWVMILLISLVVAIYSTLGGFRAVVSTDKLQYGIVALYILAMGWLAVRGLGAVANGSLSLGDIWSATWRLPPQAAKSGSAWTDLFSPGLATILITFVAYMPGWLFETDLWLRVQAARDSRQARWGVGFAAVNSLLFVGLLPLLIGIAALVIFPMQEARFPAQIGTEGDAIFAALVSYFAPAWLGLLVAVGLVAAAMSTIDTCTNVMALSVSYDLMDSSSRSREQAERISRRVTLGAVACACAFALYTESLWDIFYLSSGVLTTAVAFPVAAVFLPWATARAVTWSSAAGLSATIAAYFFESHGPLASIEPAVIAQSGLGFVLWGVAAAIAGCLAGLLTTQTPTAAPSIG